MDSFRERLLEVHTQGSLAGAYVNPHGPQALAEIERLRALIQEAVEVLRPFGNVAEQIRKAASDERWLEKVLFYMGDDNDPTKWSLTGRAFDKARALMQKAKEQSGG